jgi:inosine-uridine nucleoside N-ribohydrolase
MEADEFRRRFTTPLLKRVAEFAEVWFRRGRRITFHDPLAAAVLFNDAVCGFEKGAVRIGLGREEGIPLGATVFEAEAGPCRVAASVDAEAFFEEYFSAFR